MAETRAETRSERDKRICAENGIDLKEFSIASSGEDYIRLRPAHTADDIIIYKGGRKW